LLQVKDGGVSANGWQGIVNRDRVLTGIKARGFGNVEDLAP